MRISDWSSDGCSSDLALVDSTARMVGGFEAIALCETRKLGFLERRFCEHYGALEDATDARESVQQIAQDSTERFTGRSEERRVGKACVSTFRSRLAPHH